MNILILGSGGREAALAWKIAQSQKCEKLFIAPGNGGTSQYGVNVPLDITDFEVLKAFCLEHQIGILIPGSEDSLVAGIADYFKADPSLNSIIVAGPSKGGARLEGSKEFAKQFMQRHQIPTANYASFTEATFEEGLRYIESHTLPVVLKADGLAAGKGVVIAADREEAVSAFTAMIKDASFGAAGKTVVIEQFLTGTELSVFILTDGRHYVLLPEAKDYKRIGEQDTGPNTGGMGAVSPVPFFEGDFKERVISGIIDPTVKGLAKEGISYKGFLFFGLINVGGVPYVIEYNCRMGDPETEAVIPRIEGDLVDWLIKMDQGSLNEVIPQICSESAATVMIVSGGYPGAYPKGKEITGVTASKDHFLFHAGTRNGSGKLLTNGGRVLAVTAMGTTLKHALEVAYQSVGGIRFDGAYWRSDIGYEFL